MVDLLLVVARRTLEPNSQNERRGRTNEVHSACHVFHPANLRACTRNEAADLAQEGRSEANLSGARGRD